MPIQRKKPVYPAVMIIFSIIELAFAIILLELISADEYTVEFTSLEALNTFGMAISLVLMISCYADTYEHSREYKHFFFMLFWVHMEQFLLIVYICLNAKAEFVLWSYACHTVFIGVSVALMVEFYSYIKFMGSNRTKVVWLDKLMGILPYLGYLMLVFNIFFKYIFYIDEEGCYHRSDGYVLWMIYSGILIIISSIRILTLQAGRRIKFFLFFYVSIPISTIIVREIFDTVFLQYTGVLLALIVVYANIYIRRGEQLKSKQLQLMASQIQPHFIFNALSSIRQLSKDEQTSDIILDFSNYLRMNLNTLSDSSLVALEKELEHTKQYVRIESLRFGDRMSVSYDVEECDLLIPPLTIQPIVENAIKHGICEKEEGGTVSICGRLSADRYCLTIEDDGVGFDVNKPVNDGKIHVGMENVKLRLEQEVGGQMEVESTPGVGTKVKIYLPLKGANNYESISG